MNGQNFSTAEELDHEKSITNRNRKLKLTKDRRDHNGKFAETEGLKTIKKSRNEPLYIDDDDEAIDLTRIKRLADVVKDTE